MRRRRPLCSFCSGAGVAADAAAAAARSAAWSLPPTAAAMGGMLPSRAAFRDSAAKAGLVVNNEFVFGLDYARTLAEWRQAFENLAMRVDLDAVKGVTTTMIQTEKYGTPLASALRVLSAEFRNERMMRAEEKAARLPAIMTVPLIMFILPVLFIVILGPAACSINDALLAGK